MSLKHSSVQHNACGVMITLLKDKSLLFNEIGSVFVTSKPAPEIALSIISQLVSEVYKK